MWILNTVFHWLEYLFASNFAICVGETCRKTDCSKDNNFILLINIAFRLPSLQLACRLNTVRTVSSSQAKRL